MPVRPSLCCINLIGFEFVLFFIVLILSIRTLADDVILDIVRSPF